MVAPLSRARLTLIFRRRPSARQFFSVAYYKGASQVDKELCALGCAAVTMSPSSPGFVVHPARSLSDTERDAHNRSLN